MIAVCSQEWNFIKEEHCWMCKYQIQRLLSECIPSERWWINEGFYMWLYIINWKLKLLFIDSFTQIKTCWSLGISYFPQGGWYRGENHRIWSFEATKEEVQNATRAAGSPPPPAKHGGSACQSPPACLRASPPPHDSNHFALVIVNLGANENEIISQSFTKMTSTFNNSPERPNSTFLSDLNQRSPKEKEKTTNIPKP